MRVIKIDKLDNANGEGLRTVVWVSGCKHHCKGCHNPETQSFELGHRISSEDIKTMVQYTNEEHCEGITFTGGDPLDELNRDALLEVVEIVKKVTNKTVWVYTGGRMEDILPNLTLWEIDKFSNIDVVVDGEFKEELKVRGKFYGSSNQRLVDVKETIEQRRIVEYCLGN